MAQEIPKPDKRKVLKDLGDRLGKAVLAELLAQKKHQDARQVFYGARTPTAEDKACIAAAKQGWMARSRERIMILNQMEDLLGIVHKPRKPPGEIVDGADPEDHA